MYLTIHRGTHEIGGSCVEITSLNSRIIIDIGMPLVNADGGKFNMADYEDLSGQELVERKVLPDVPGLYRWDKEGKIADGLLISHPHMDHYGFYKYVREDITYYVGEGAKRLMDITALFTPAKGQIHKYVPLKSGIPFICGDFTITPYLMDHSAFDSYAFLIEADGKKVIYSGDFRNHGRKGKAFYYFLYAASKNADALVLEGTMLGRKNEICITESEVEDKIVRIIKGSNKIVLADFSAQNIDRLVTFYRAAKRAGRIFVVDLYTANVMNAIKDYASIPHQSFAFPDIKVFYPRSLTRRIINEDHGILAYRFRNYKIKGEEINRLSHKILMLVRPKMEMDLDFIKSLDGGTFIYSMWKGYIEDNKTKELLDYINHRNMKTYMLHTSGHADIQTLKRVVDELKPRCLIPIHTFCPDSFDVFNADIKRLSDDEAYYI